MLNISDMEGQRIEGEENVHRGAIHFFSTLLGQDNSSVHTNRVQVNRKLTTEYGAYMVREVTGEEIKAAMFSINSKKASEPDVSNAGFFKANWDIVGPAITNAVKSFFRSGKVLNAWNATSLTLILPCRTFNLFLVVLFISVSLKF